MSTLLDPENTRSERIIKRVERATCQLYTTYLPPSYLPPSCKDTPGITSWAYSIINTVFVSATTIFNTTIFLSVVFLWLVNRQFHFKNRHSYDKKPLRPLKKPAKALRSASAKLKKVSKRLSKKLKKAEVERRARGDSLAQEEHDAKLLAEQKRHKSFQSFLEDFDEEEEEDEAIEKSLLSHDAQKKEQPNRDRPRVPELIAKRKRKKDLLHLASKIEVFSYLSPEAVADILEYVEYVDFNNVGDVVFDTNTLDGSMYAVVQGEVTTSLSVLDTGPKEDFSFVAGPGEVITSMLSIITSLVREYQLQDALLYSLIPGVLGDGTGMGGVGTQDMSSDNNKIVIPNGMNIHAIVTSSNTRLLRIPSRCFVAILEKFPRDVHNICQTIVARLQRVTIQTLVRFLGLDAGILGIGGPAMTSSTGDDKIPEKKLRNSTAEWGKLEQSLLSGPSDTLTASSVLDQATSAAASLLGLTPEQGSDLKDGTEIIHAPPGSVICSKGQPPSALYLILKGKLDIGLDKSGQRGTSSPLKRVQSESSENGDHKKAVRSKRASSNLSSFEEHDKNSPLKPLFSAAPGNWVGLFSCFTHDASFITVHATEGALLLKIPATTFESVVSKYPRALIHSLLDIIDTVGDGANLCVSPSMFLLDMSLDWMHVEAGEYIALKGEPCDSMFVVLNGRLRTESSTSEDDSKGNQKSQEEYGRGATIGELEALAEGSWNQSVYASRHVEVARIPSQIIGILMEMFPSAGIHFAKVIATQVHSRTGPMGSPMSLLPSYGLSLATIAVVPLTEEVDVSAFSSYLTNSLRSIAPTKLLTKNETKLRVGDDFFKHRNAMLKVKMTRILGDMEANDRMVVYESDYKYTWWTKLCVQQADCVLLIVDSRSAPEQQRVEELLAWANERKNVRVELVVVQSSSAQEEAHSHIHSRDVHASDTLNNWCEQRPWITKQHLVRCDFADHVKDFRRMTRRITGQSIGLVLGGGGARGLAHLGIIRALNEVGVEVDIVGGTSQGAFIGALLARNPDDWGLLCDAVGEMASDMSSISNKLRDLTFPLTSFFSGHHFNLGIQRVLGNIRMQDFVLNYFCVSVDIVNSVQVVHTKGLAWKYIRASMSLAGYLPPISEKGRLLVDGGYMNVLPADVMSQMGAKKIIAVDVAKEETSEYYDYGTELSGLWLLCNSWNPFVQTVKVPSMGDINERLSWVSSERMKKDIINSKVDLFLKPPVNHIGTLDFDKIGKWEVSVV